jgi:hypothetical protein
MSLPPLSGCGAQGDKQETAVSPGVPTTAQNVTASLKEVGRQQWDGYLLTLLSETGVVRQGANRFVLEIRDASTNELVPVDRIHVETTMEMPGRSPMVGRGSAVPGDVPGRYIIGSDFAAAPPVGIGDDVSSQRAGRMAGQWKLVVILHPNQRIEFTASVN